MTALGGALLAGMLLFPARIPAQSKPTLPRRVVAVRAQGIAPRVDGRLDDSVWVRALPAGDFVLREPTEGAAAPERTEVRFVYTHDALYVGARMYSDAPGAVRALVARRDQKLPSEQLVVSLDTRGDRITVFSFAVTPGGVRLDYHHPSDVESSRDYSYVGGSYVAGDSAAILAQQFSSRRYYQRPDAGYVGVDPRRTSLSGITAGINHSKNAGNWLWDIDYTHESPGLELNDLGSLGTADDRSLFTNLRYRQTRPGGALHSWVLGAFESAEWNFGGTRTFTELGVFGDLTFRNFWQAEFEFNVLPRSHRDNLTRGGPLMQSPLTWRLFTEFAGPSGARTRWSIEPNFGVDELDGWFATVEGFLSLRPAARWELVIEPRYARTVTPRQFVATRPDGGPATFGGRYIFGRVDRSEVVVRLRLNYALKPDLTLEAYLEPFASSGRYRDLGELAAARSFALRPYGGDGTSLTRQGDSVYVVTDGPSQFTFPVPDFDIRSLRSNLVLRWEWMPGSTAFLVWQQDRFRREIPRESVGIGGSGRRFRSRAAISWR
ncbi:MAG TPA: DUF5916 domain-containing protein [Gemmatimonadales bacterium]